MIGRWLCAFLATAAATAACAAPTQDPSSLASIAPPPDAQAPMNLAFRDQHGGDVTLGDLAAGRPLVLVPVQHTCRNLCGLTLEALRSAWGRSPAADTDGVALVAFGIDPRETPSDAAASAAQLGGGPRVEALVGDSASVAAVTRALGYRYTWISATGQYAHLAAVAVLTPDGRLVRWLPGLGVKPTELQAILEEARHGQAPSLADDIRLLCFHFDPSTGRYTLAIWRLTEAAAGLTAALVAGGVGLAFWRERRRAA
ncbi:MAG TPA: SCO family protein [Caulobacteraceae bacterium]|jgi:protein SCO1/2